MEELVTKAKDLLVNGIIQYRNKIDKIEKDAEVAREYAWEAKTSNNGTMIPVLLTLGCGLACVIMSIFTVNKAYENGHKLDAIRQQIEERK